MSCSLWKTPLYTHIRMEKQMSVLWKQGLSTWIPWRALSNTQGSPNNTFKNWKRKLSKGLVDWNVRVNFLIYSLTIYPLQRPRGPFFHQDTLMRQVPASLKLYDGCFLQARKNRGNCCHQTCLLKLNGDNGTVIMDQVVTLNCWRQGW